MRVRLLFFCLTLMALALVYTGCSGVQRESFGSDWTTLVADEGTPSTIATTTPDPTQTATPSAELKITVLPAQAAVQNDNKVPVSVTLVGSISADVKTKVAMSSSLGGTFVPESGEFEDGNFMTTFTAPATVTGNSEIVALAGSIIGTCAIQILPKDVVIYQVQVSPAALTIGLQQSTLLTVKVIASNGMAVDSSKVVLSSSLQSTLVESSGDTVKGIFTSLFTSGNTSGNCTITAVAEGATGTAVIAISAPSIQILPSLNPITHGEEENISVKVTAENGNPLKGVKVLINSSSGGSFSSTAEDTDDNGFAYFKYTAPATDPAPLTGSDVLTVQALGVTKTLSLTIQ
ncbi:MAG: hypothetical protein A2W80_11580 [Candidatus Riflebacteria bacterium GWC2_50_8]|nr:MAG: hypothetical protein A2W80_11580 [Candidatus Riflebacteria bacterium GWC2_50_8]